MIPCFGMHKICWLASAKSTIAANESNKVDSGFDCNCLKLAYTDYLGKSVGYLREGYQKQL